LHQQWLCIQQGCQIQRHYEEKNTFTPYPFVRREEDKNNIRKSNKIDVLTEIILNSGKFFSSNIQAIMSTVNTITLNFITKIIFKHIIWQP